MARSESDQHYRKIGDTCWKSSQVRRSLAQIAEKAQILNTQKGLLQCLQGAKLLIEATDRVGVVQILERRAHLGIDQFKGIVGAFLILDRVQGRVRSPARVSNRLGKRRIDVCDGDV